MAGERVAQNVGGLTARQVWFDLPQLPAEVFIVHPEQPRAGIGHDFFFQFGGDVSLPM
ncbi:hypothetical protein ACZ87_03841 [Candidatus Erwinia dacicola]|uniref:Uncharacterized protein n=1 Tax=Candidatus Erwinia dacicola TaxID=252393 RepID=A0A328TDM8_9GAMM|nr:hypothetical protein ACZ87_03841 [Candidatus Erwinia dacicola]